MSTGSTTAHSRESGNPRVRREMDSRFRGNEREGENPPYLPQLYGRSKGHALKPSQQRLMAELLPTLAIPEGLVDLDLIFPQAENFALEIGFGGGEHLALQAAHEPTAGFIGAETYLNGVAKLLQRIDAGKLSNVRILHGDARPLIEALPDGRLSRIFVLHPDPWPKKRHHKRRMISPWFFEQAARLLKPAGILRVASDIPDYVRWTLMHAQNAPAFDWTAGRARDWTERPDDWPQTRYEAKAAAEGRRAVYLEFRRR